MADKTTASSTTSVRKPYVRVVTDKRREQNRTSQKKYRERLKKRLEELEEQVASTDSKPKNRDEDDLPACSVPLQADNRGSPELVSDLDLSDHEGSNIDGQTNRALAAPWTPHNIDFDDIFQAAGDLALPKGLSGGLTTNLMILDGPLDPWNYASAGCDLEGPTASAATSDVTAFDLMPKSDPDAIDMRQFWPVPAAAYTTPYNPPPQSPSSRASSVFPPQYLGAAYSRSISTAGSSTSHLPDPYINHLQLSGETFISSTLAIAASIGISQAAYINDHPSLFYKSTEPNFRHLPRNLRPTPAQILLPHPVYLDCIIFPAFRTRLIIKSARGELDHGSLFVDLLNGGLVCWGNANATSEYGRGMRDGVAWSPRSWEATCWFLQRWKTLIGKEDVEEDEVEDFTDEDGIWEQSRWWWAMRGDAWEM